MKKLIIAFLLVGICFAIHADEGTVEGGGTPYAIEKIEYDDDKSANNKEYFGWALPNTATSVTSWKIMRITYSGNDFTLEWADGDRNYDNEWDNRTTLTYK